MIGEWCYFKSHFSKEQCEKIISDAANIPVQDALVGTNETTHMDTSSRRSKIRFIYEGDFRFTWLFDELWKMARSANNDFFNIHISRLPFIQLAEYDAEYQGEYKTHHDVFWLNGDPMYHRKLSAVIQLSDPNVYQGGDLEITESVSSLPDVQDLRQQGTAFFFPSMFMHKANQVTRGKRYSIAAWFEGPKWR
jgi:PKHD-type hydroxylase